MTGIALLVLVGLLLWGCLLGAGLAVVYRAAERSRAAAAPRPPLPVVAVKTRGDVMLTGRLRSRDAQVMVLADAQKLDPPATPGGPAVAIPMDGDVLVPWDNVDYWQEGLPAELLDRG